MNMNYCLVILILLISAGYCGTMPLKGSKSPGLKVDFSDSMINMASLKRILAPDVNSSQINIITVAKWPHRFNTYAIIGVDSSHMSDETAEPYFYLTLIEYVGPGKQPNLLARYPGKLDLTPTFSDERVEWNNQHVSFSSFDFAPYRITNQMTALGIRFTDSEMYAGGGEVTYILLILLVIQDSELKIVFSTPISFDGSIRGEWEDDGIRGWEKVGNDCVIIMLPRKGSKYQDLMLKCGDGLKKIFKWTEMGYY